ncbi:GtrA family protein [Rurimicrobium arvi]|uniref:GtrA/DPMS transmembrane domain-containing protein n=1 Tax=Rurimicrobium arvi TaxID=2049916 RepID=A0ABP8MP06_9BACT
MRKTRDNILRFIDFFHPPFRRWIDLQTFRYLACGGSNQLLNIFLYWFCFNIILLKQDVPLPDMKPIGGPIASFIFASAFTIPIGFVLSKYVVFQESNLRGRIQLFRYMVLTGTCFILNYWMLKLFVNVMHIFPTVSQTITIVLLAIFSYIVQRFFTFRVKNAEPELPFPDTGE